MNESSKLLLKSLQDAGDAPVYMTAQEGEELARMNLIQVDANDSNGSNPPGFRVRITEVGVAALDNDPSSAFEIEDNIPIPTIKRGNTSGLRPRKSRYPFDKLEINQSFHVPVTEKDPEPWKKMASNVAAANRRNMIEVEPQEMVQVTHKTLQKGSDGKALRDAEGKAIYTESVATEAKKIPAKRFVARQVNGEDPKGAGVRVFRVDLAA